MDALVGSIGGSQGRGVQDLLVEITIEMIIKMTTKIGIRKNGEGEGRVHGIDELFYFTIFSPFMYSTAGSPISDLDVLGEISGYMLIN